MINQAVNLASQLIYVSLLPDDNLVQLIQSVFLIGRLNFQRHQALFKLIGHNRRFSFWGLRDVLTGIPAVLFHPRQAAAIKSSGNFGGILAVLLILCMLWSSGGASAAEGSGETVNEPLTLLMGSVNYPPYIGENLPAGGPMARIVQQAFARVGYQAHVRFYPWSRAIMQAREGLLDGLFTVWMREERKSDFVYSEPLYPNRLRLLMHREDADGVQSLEDITGWRIGNVRKYSTPKKLLAMPVIVDDDAYDDRNNIHRLLRRRVDAILIDERVGRYLLDSCFVVSKRAFAFSEVLLFEEPQYFVVGRANPRADAIVAAFNRGYREMKDSFNEDELLSQVPLGPCDD